VIRLAALVFACSFLLGCQLTRKEESSAYKINIATPHGPITGTVKGTSETITEITMPSMSGFAPITGNPLIDMGLTFLTTYFAGSAAKGGVRKLMAPKAKP
jgi:hypothetical protein